jgi:hypothetical protein
MSFYYLLYYVKIHNYAFTTKIQIWLFMSIYFLIFQYIYFILCQSIVKYNKYEIL